MRKPKNFRRNDAKEKETITINHIGEINMLSAIEMILNISENSSLDAALMKPLEPFFKYISDLQGLTNIQALLLALMVEESSDGNVVTCSRLARFLDCTNVRIMQFQEDIDDMVKRRFLRRTKRRYGPESMGYVVPEDVITAIKGDTRFVPKSLAAKNGIHFFQLFFDLTHQRKEEEIDTELLIEEFVQLLEANASLRFVKRLEKLNLSDNSKLIVTHLARHLVLSQHEQIPIESMEYLFDDRHMAYNELHSLEEGRHVLIKKGIVEYAGKQEFLDKATYKLSDKAKENLLKGFSLPKHMDAPVMVVKADGIVKKKLFFNDMVGRQIHDLSEMLSVERFAAIQARLKERGRRTGFACLFYGAPGTGKTESVLQIAHATRRDIMQVDMSEIKSKWVGESEQNIKAVFDNYRALCKVCDKTPILLFNEADAILGKRMGQAMRAVDKMNNAIQNIVLQEMETLDGIMIATTNLEQSLDGAFERRFLYKVRFERPDVEQRRKIWLSMMPSLTDDFAFQLATDYDFSGGQIENIVRKCDVESILYGDSAIDADKIHRFCQEETILQNNTARIGFFSSAPST